MKYKIQLVTGGDLWSMVVSMATASELCISAAVEIIVQTQCCISSLMQIKNN